MTLFRPPRRKPLSASTHDQTGQNVPKHHIFMVHTIKMCLNLFLSSYGLKTEIFRKNVCHLALFFLIQEMSLSPFFHSSYIIAIIVLFVAKKITISTINKKLDPNLHQAMMEIDDENNEPGTVVQEIQKGYIMKDRLLRPSLVAVSKKPEKTEEKSEKKTKK